MQHVQIRSLAVLVGLVGFMFHVGCGIALCQSTTHEKVEREDAWVVKLDSLGKLDWKKSFPGHACISSVISLDDGFFLAAGTTGKTIETRKQPWLIRLDAEGKEAWSKTYGAVEGDQFQCLQKTRGGLPIVVGTTASTGAKDAWLVKFDQNGSQQWTRSYGGDQVDEGIWIAPSVGGGFVVAGVSWSYGGVGRALVFKVDSTGAQQWAKVYDEIDRAMSIAWTPDRTILVAGETLGPEGAMNTVVLKLDSKGNKLWAKTFENLVSPRVQILHGGGTLVSGSSSDSSSPSTRDWKLVLIKLQTRGREIWRRAYPGIFAQALLSTPDSGFVVGGWSTVFSISHLADAYIVKFDSEGLVQWTQNLGGKEWEEILSIDLAKDGGYVAGGLIRFIHEPD
jgi:hypothetical protein